jgi:hypothetical protein
MIGRFLIPCKFSPQHNIIISEQFKLSEGERLRPYEIVAHDHTYCLRPDSVQPTRSVCCEQTPLLLKILKYSPTNFNYINFVVVL